MVERAHRENRNSFRTRINEILRHSSLSEGELQQYHVLIVSWVASQTDPNSHCTYLRDQLRNRGYNAYTYSDLKSFIASMENPTKTIAKIASLVDVVVIVCRKADLRGDSDSEDDEQDSGANPSRFCISSVEQFDTSGPSADRLRFYLEQSIDRLPTAAFDEPISPLPRDHQQFNGRDELLKLVGPDVRSLTLHQNSF